MVRHCNIGNKLKTLHFCRICFVYTILHLDLIQIDQLLVTEIALTQQGASQV